MKYPVRSEQLKHSITIIKPKVDTDGNTVQNDYGELTGEMQDVATNIHAFVDPTGGNEFYAAQRINSEADHNVWIRYRNDVGYGMKVKYGQRVFDIITKPIDLYEAHRWMRLICKELI